MTDRENRTNASGGAAGIRGYQVQTLIALLKIVSAKSPFEKITLEPSRGHNQFDYVWTDSAGKMFAVQVKSTKGAFQKHKIERWAQELANARTSESCKLVLVGRCTDKANGFPEHAGVEIERQALASEELLKVAAQDVGLFVEEERLGRSYASGNALIAEALMTRLSQRAANQQPLSRDEFVELLKKWVRAASPVDQANTLVATAVKSPAELLAAHRKYLRGAHDRLNEFFPEASYKALHEVYVEIDLESIQNMHRYEADAERKRSRSAATLQTLLELPTSTKNGVTGRWSVQGEPGAGKSTIARHLTWQLANKNSGPIPMYCSLARMAKENKDPFELAESDLGSDGPGLAAALKALGTRDNGLWILLDGLDEVAPEDQGRVLERLAVLAELATHAKIAVLSRPIAFANPNSQFVRARLRPLGPKRRRELLRRWLGRSTAARVWREIDGSKSLSEFSSNPLLLTLLASLARLRKDDKPLPHKLVDLFGEVVPRLLDSGYKTSTVRGRELNVHLAILVLEELALILQESRDIRWTKSELHSSLKRARQSDVGAFTDSRALDEEVRRQESWRNPDQILDDLSGVLGPHDGRYDPWRFLHRQLREFLAARALQRRLKKDRAAEIERVKKLTTPQLPRWSEVYGFVVSMERDPIELIRALKQANGALAVRALRDAPQLSPELVAEMLSGVERLEYGIFRRMVVAWGIETQDEKERASQALMRLVEVWSADRSKWWIECISYVYYLLNTELVPPTRERFFDVAGLPISKAPSLDWIAIPGGQYKMGSDPRDGLCYPEERPQQPRTIRAFELARTVVTREQFRRFSGDEELKEEKRQLPATEVSWWEAYLYCAWIGGRLPSEAEWEYACRGKVCIDNDRGFLYYWSGYTSDDLDRVGWYDRNSGGRPHPVATKTGNKDHPGDEHHPFGLRDMHGNVWEWCEDKWHDNYIGAPTDGSAWVDAASEDRVCRGGSFRHPAWVASSTFRNRFHPSDRRDSVGFRPASFVRND